MIRSARWLVPVAILVPTQAWALHVPADYRTIQEAVDAAGPWDTIFVDGTRYTTENAVTITQSVIIRPEKSADTPDTGADTGTATSPYTVYYPNFLVIEASLRLYDGVIQSYGDMAGTSSSGGTFSGQAGIALLGSGELLVEDVSFFDGPDYAIYATDAQVTLVGGVISGFDGAHAVKVTSVAQDATLSIDGTLFENNSQNAVYMADYTTHYTNLDVTGATFVNNQSYEYGGDIWLHQVDYATISSISSVGSGAASAGGSIMMRGTSGTITDSTFSGNYAAFAGAIYLEGTESSWVNLTNLDFSNNMALGSETNLAYGGDMSIVNGSATLDQVDSTGSSGIYGGSIAALNSTVYVVGGQYNGVSAETGGVFYGDGTTLNMQGSEVCGAWGGGSLIQSVRGDVYLQETFFQANTVESGAMVLVDDADLTVLDTTLVANAAAPSIRGSNGALSVINTLFHSSGTIEGTDSSPTYVGYNLYSAAGDGSELSTLGKDVYADPVFWPRYREGVCGSLAYLTEGSPGAGQGYAAYDLDIGAFPVVDTPDDTGVVHTGIIETGITDTDTAVEPHTGGDDTAPAPDSDGDGTPDDEDCAPDDPDIHPGAYDDPLDDIDQDCDDDAAAGLAHGGCGCDTTGPVGAALAFAGLLLLTRRRASG